MAASLLLDIVAWDLTLDARGRWALASDPYAIAQNASCICRLIEGEASYDLSRGVPYWTDIFAGVYPIELARNDLETAAEMIDGVDNAVVYIQAIVGRQVSGQLQLTTPYGPLYASV